MHEKNHDSFFDEDNTEAQGEKHLLTMISGYDKPVVDNLEVGKKVSGKVVSVGSKNLFVEVGGKNEAALELQEYARNNIAIPAVGDTIEAFVVSITDGITLSTRMSSKATADSSLSDILNAMETKLPVEGKVTGINKGGFNVKIMGQRAFCPISQIDLRRVEDPNVWLNRVLPFVITRVTENGRNIVVSRLPLLEDDMEKVLTDIVAKAESKAVISGPITRIMPFGLFVDIGGFEGLVHISEVSWERAEDLEKSFALGQMVECLLLGVERKEPLRNSKISLSIKQVIDNPWTTVGTTFSVGQSVQGKITRLASFGAFVQLIPGVEGLIHISEMTWDKKVRHPQDLLSPGQIVTISILGINLDKREISCSLKDADSDPWKDIETRFGFGTAAQGTVAQSTKFGYFVDLAPGVTGLLPFQNIAADKKESIKVGDVLEIVIESIDLDRRRLSLSYGTAEEKKNAADVKQFMNTQKAVQAEPAESAFAAAFKNALAKKK